MVYRLAVRTTVAVLATLTPTPLLMRRMMPVRLPADDLRRIAGCPWKNRWMPQLCDVALRVSYRRLLGQEHDCAVRPTSAHDRFACKSQLQRPSCSLHPCRCCVPRLLSGGRPSVLQVKIGAIGGHAG